MERKLLYVEGVNEKFSREDGGSPDVRVRSDESLSRARQAALAARVVLDTRGTSAKDAAVLLAIGWRSIEALSDSAGAWLSRLEGSPSRLDLRLALAELARTIRAQDAWRIKVHGSRRERVVRLAARIALWTSGVVLVVAIATGLVVSLSIPNYDEGLTATYYTKRGQTGHSFERTDHQVSFSWGTGAPMKGVGRDRFSVRWEGCLIVEPGPKPTLVAGADDSVRVRIDGVKVIEDWKSHRFRTRTARDGLAPGVHRIRVDYEEFTGDARVFLGWSRNGEPPRPIPAESLVPRTGNRRHTCP
jgi:hypothetical protein